MPLPLGGRGLRLKWRPAGSVWTYRGEIAALCNGHRSAVWTRLRVKPKQAYCSSHYQTQREFWIPLQGWINTTQTWPGLLPSNTADQGLNPGPTTRMCNGRVGSVGTRSSYPILSWVRPTRERIVEAAITSRKAVFVFCWIRLTKMLDGVATSSTCWHIQS